MDKLGWRSIDKVKGYFNRENKRNYLFKVSHMIKTKLNFFKLLYIKAINAIVKQNEWLKIVKAALYYCSVNLIANKFSNEPD